MLKMRHLNKIRRIIEYYYKFLTRIYLQYTQNVCIFSLENRNTSESRENHKTVDMKVTLLKLTRQKGGQSVLMVTKGLAGVRPQSKVAHWGQAPK